uniref:CDP-glycerol glycerophosphotransferase family protein n=1 Tax=Candidatus Ventrenecus sp. TaxID=3085654 RepID=UPI003FF07E7C
MKSKIDYFIISFKASIMTFFSPCLKIDNEKIIVDNFLGKGYGDNGKYIIENLHKLNTSYKIIWVVRKMDEEMPDYIKKVKYGSFKSLYHYATSKIWIDNVRNNIKPKKKQEQYYLQTWHGPFSSKKIERMAASTLSTEYVKLAKKDGKIANAILSNSHIQNIQYKNWFWLDKNVEILKLGFPRNDYLINNQNNRKLIQEVKKRLNIKNNNYLILYAPTFRDDFSIDGYKIDFSRVLKQFEKKTNKKCKILIRMHPNVQKYSKCINYSDDILNVTSYPNMQDLSLISDAIISDYSSTLFDFAIQKKPAFICALDIDNYKKTRGLVDEYFSYPFPFSTTNDDLLTNIEKFDYEKYLKNLQNYFETNPLYDDGLATINICNLLIKICRKEDK